MRTLDAARKAGITVIFSTDEHTPDDAELKKWPAHSMKGTKWAEILPELGPVDGDLVLPKTTYSGFLSSDIEKKLQDRGINRSSFFRSGLQALQSAHETHIPRPASPRPVQSRQLRAAVDQTMTVSSITK